MRPHLGPTHPSVRHAAVDHLIAELAELQHGVINRWQLRELGLTDDAIKHRVRAGRLHRIAPVVYAVGHRTLDLHAVRLRAVRTFRDDAFLSHRSGGAVWEMGWDPTTTTHVSVMHRRGLAPRDGITLHRPRTLRPEDVTIHRGLPVTTPARTIFDIAATEPAWLAERAIEDAENHRIFDLRKINALLDRKVPGTKTIAELLESVDPNQQTQLRSKLEEAFHLLSRKHNLERPRWNEFVEGWRVDAHWPKHHLVVELDSAGFHMSRAAFERDRRQDVELQSKGWRVLRFTYLRVKREPDLVIATVERMLTPATLHVAA